MFFLPCYCHIIYRSIVRTANKYIEHDMITSFTGDFAFLSPDFQCQVMLAGDANVYPSFEHALQASKTTDENVRSQLRDIADVRELKRMAGKLCGVSDSWKEKSVQVAEQLIRDKFFRNKDLTALLMKTEHRTIQYVNDFKDMFWGMTPDKKGQNKLGKAIEAVRFSIERGEILEKWIKDHFQLVDPDKVSISVKVQSDDEGTTSAASEIFERKPVLEIGKLDDNDVVTEHPTTSRRHAVLLVDKVKGPVLIDLHSPNGTFVNKERIEPFVPVPVGTSETVIVFAASRHQHVFVVDTEADVRRREEILRRMIATDTSSDRAEDTTVFVGNLPYDCTEQQLRDVFESCGPIRGVTLPRDKTGTGEGRGIAFITFDTLSGLRQALTRDGDDIGGRMVKVKRSEAKSKTASGVAPQGARAPQKRSVNHDDGADSYYKPRPTSSQASSQSTGSHPYDRDRSRVSGSVEERHGREGRGDEGGGGRERKRGGRSASSSRSSSRGPSRRDRSGGRGEGRNGGSERRRKRSDHRRSRSRSNCSSSSSSPDRRQRPPRRHSRHHESPSSHSRYDDDIDQDVKRQRRGTSEERHISDRNRRDYGDRRERDRR